MTRKEVHDQVGSLVDKYEALEGRARSQTHRDAIANTAMVLLLQWRRDHRKEERATLAALPVRSAPPSEWGITRASTRWSGTCRRCAKPGLPGQRLAWDPKSGKPSTWQHVSCEDPYGKA